MCSTFSNPRISSRLLQFAKAQLPIFFSPLGNVTSTSPVSPKKALSANSSIWAFQTNVRFLLPVGDNNLRTEKPMLLFNSSLCSDGQFEKRESPIKVTPSGITTSVSDLLEKKAFFPIYVKPSGKVTFFSSKQYAESLFSYVI